MTRTVLLSLLVLGLQSTGSLRATEQTDPFVATIANVKSAVGAVVCLTRKQDGSGEVLHPIRGTAFFVSKEGQFVTAGHVVRRLRPANECPIKGVYLPVGQWKPGAFKINAQATFFHVENCTINDALDVAVCRTDDNLVAYAGDGVSVQPVTFDSSVQPDGTPIAFTGFPLDIPNPLTSVGRVATYRGLAGQDAAEIILDKNAWPGASGSPIFLSNGRVIGMIVEAGMNEGAGLAYARSSAAIEQVLAGRVR